MGGEMYMAYSSLTRITEMGGVEADICGDEMSWQLQGHAGRDIGDVILCHCCS